MLLDVARMPKRYMMMYKNGEGYSMLHVHFEAPRSGHNRWLEGITSGVTRMGISRTTNLRVAPVLAFWTRLSELLIHVEVV